MNQLSEKRDVTIDGMKGLAILLIVMGHSGCRLTPFFYLFHVALFFMISGYLWNDKNAETLQSAGRCVWRKIKSLWLPFVLWNQTVLLCNNLWIALHIYTDQPAAAELSSSIPIHHHMAPGEFIKPFLKMFLFRTDEELSGATWFLAALFVVSVMHLGIRFVCRRLKHGEGIFLGIFALVAVYCQICCMNVKIPGPLLVTRALYAYFAFLLGYFFRKYQKTEKSKTVEVLLLGASSAILIAAYWLGWENSVGGMHADSILMYALLTIAGWYFCRSLVLLCPQVLRNLLVFTGKHTLSIVLLHFLMFRLVSLLYVFLVGMPVELAASFPVIVSGEHGWLWIPYTAAGVVLSLVCGIMASRLRKWILSRFCSGKKEPCAKG